jgi:hypothetical protein
MCVNDVMWPAAFEPGIFHFVIDMPPVVFQHKLNPVRRQVPVHSCRIRLRDGRCLIASNADRLSVVRRRLRTRAYL